LNNVYLIGPLGYDGRGMTWTMAIVRLAGYSAIFLLPLWLLFLTVMGKAVRRAGKPAWSLLKPLWPLLMAFLCIAGLRNYFANHPWMAGPVLIYGIVFSLRLLLDCTPSASPEASQALPGRPLLTAGLPLAAGFAYSLAIMLCLDASEAGGDALLRLARQNTQRHDLIFFSPQDDPDIAAKARRFATLTDRILLPLPDSKETAPASETQPGARFQLTAQLLPNRHLLASTALSPSPVKRFIVQSLKWYRAVVARRHKGDAIEIEQVLYLYQLP
jgi:hypothetical protein